MRIQSRQRIQLLLILLTLGINFSSPVLANKNQLMNYYTSLQPVLNKNVYGIPIYIDSRDENNTMKGTIYGIIKHPFDFLANSVTLASHWCELAPQHLNIKACTYQPVNQKCLLRFYSGRKFYEKADDVYQLEYRFELLTQEMDFIHIRLSAEEGPVGTSHYQINLKAIPLNEKQSFVYFSYTYQYNFIASMAMGTYLSTVGSDKLGFSITGQDMDGKPVYIKGVRGIIERNSVRYFLAIKSFLDTLNLPTEKRFEARINQWFDLTERYHRQLYEMDKADYLVYKNKERLDQIRLQGAIKTVDSKPSICR
ncbi:MAG: hypothetical protein OEY52_15585 [Gammaproteobacteria bacterium]|nr:hypothetical protein [Gammaproteobacteria bacterium]